MHRVMAGCAAGLCLTALALATPAEAQTARAYALVELAADSDSSAAFEALRSLSLMNCLQLVESLVPGEVVLHVECNDLASLSQALTADFPKVEGVARVTMWTVTTGQ
jgi:hypothetical protein